MTIHGCCPKCGSEISHDRFINGQAICKCGWFDDRSARQAALSAERKTILSMIVGAFVLAIGFGHIATWGSDAISVPLMKVQQMTGTLSDQGYEKLATSCLTHGKYECAQKTYQKRYSATRNVEALAQLAKLNMQLGQNEDSLASYTAYFQAGGDDTEAAYLHGKLLESANRFEEAIDMYELAAEKSEETLPVLSTGAIVRLLIKQGRYEDAYSRIQDFHESSEQAKGYLNTELSQLENHLQGSKSKKNSRSTTDRSTPKVGASKRVVGV